jgi:pimeloyl-ACP methyl ester carboxylesterase
MTAETVILIHGLWMTGAEMSLLKKRLRAADFHVIQFRYRTLRRSLDHNSGRLASLIREQDKPVNLIGHSLGGVLALQLLQREPELNVDKVICLGAPLLDAAAGRRFHKSRPGRVILGKTLPEAVYVRPLERWSGNQPVGVIAGTAGMGLGRLVTRLPKPNDGMVTLAETCLPGVSDHLSVKTGHTGLILSAEVARQCICFIRAGRFSR